MIANYDSTVSLSYLIDILNNPPLPAVASAAPPREACITRTQPLLGVWSSEPNGFFFCGASRTSAPRYVQHRYDDPTVYVGSSDMQKFMVRTPVLVKQDPWVQETLRAISKHRNLPEGWDGSHAAPPSDDALDVAEMLALGFTVEPINRRPQFIVDTEGQPSFTAYTDDVYLHLTVDGPSSVSWFKTANGVEEFHDAVVVSVDNARDVARRIMSIPA